MRKSVFNFLLFYVLPIPVVLASLFVGASEHASFVDYSTLFWKFIQGTLSTEELLRWEADTNIILNIRLPRVLLTFLIGAALSTSGVVLQGCCSSSGCNRRKGSCTSLLRRLQNIPRTAEDLHMGLRGSEGHVRHGCS